jgi:ABC-type uncharacterized transport system involved in gliding motility auxiliary subunit
MNKKQIETILYSTVGVVVMLVIILAANLIGHAIKARIDLTSERLYTLSPGTKAILSKLDTPIKIRFYCSRGSQLMPVTLKTYAQRVEDLLAEYKQAGKGNIEIEKYDPEPDSDAEDSARLDGIEGQMVNMAERVYLGLSVTCVDSKETIPFLTPERQKLLEYDLSRAIARAAHPEKPVLGVMTALPMFGMTMNPMMMQMQQQQPQPSWVVVNELKRDFNVREIPMAADKINDDIKVLLVAYPKDIPEKTQFAIDQFVLRGGKLIAFLDPMSITDKDNQMGGPSGGGTLDKLLKAWGLEFDTNKVVADMNYMTQLNRGSGPETAPAVLSLNAQAINKEDTLTTQLDSLLFAYAGVFTGTPADGLKQTILAKTSTQSQLIEKMMAQMGGEQTVQNFAPSGKEYTLALRLSGKFKTAFPDGKPADPATDKNAVKPVENSLKASTAETSVILVGDSDWLYDPLCVQVQNFFGQRIAQPINGNLNLAQSIVEQLSGDDNLIAVRSRATLNRPFTKVKKMQARAEDNYRSKIKDLEANLATTQQRIDQLQQNKEQGQRFILSPEQQQEIERFRKEEANAKKELKEVRKSLRRDIDSLENRLKWVNIAGMPFLVTVTGVSLAFFKRKRTAAK